jgi:S1-C subfamily serine protease
LTLRDALYGTAGTPKAAPARIAQVVGVEPGTLADQAGLRPGDVIVQADGRSMPTSEQVGQALQDGGVLLLVRRGDSSFYAALRR